MTFESKLSDFCSALLRVSGLPVRYWLAGANPALFEKVQSLDHAEGQRRECAIRLAEQIGRQIVPNPAISRDDRAFLLSLRRTLHRGDPVADVPRERLLQLGGLSKAEGELVQSLVAMIDGDRAIAMLSVEVERELALEQDRLLLLADEIYRESVVARALLLPRGPETPGSLEPLSRKSRRHRSEHEWRRIARAATGSTPREWLSHVALVPIEPGDQVRAPALTEQFTAQWMENVRAPGLALGHPPEDWPAAENEIAVNPLSWDADGSLVFVVLDESREHTQVAVRRTPLLDSIGKALGDTAHTFGELAEALGCVDPVERLTLRGFVRHLVILGILQPGAPPQVRLERRAIPGETFARQASLEHDGSAWVDVYRYAETGISASLVRQVQNGVSQTLRLLNLIRDGAPKSSPSAVSTSKRSWSLTELLRAELGAGDKAISKREDAETEDSDVLPGSPDAGFERLVRTIAERAGNASELVIDSSLLDECGAPEGALTWPVDCLVRMPANAEVTGVLDELLPAGMLDARFADTLLEMHGRVPHMEAYREFLRHLEQATGVLFVELLLPPLQDGAANAVRRPAYTGAWTGDPHTAAYLRSGAPGRYIPLNAIKIRRVEGRLRAEVGGQHIWPVYHATRSFSPPWDRLARVLLAAAPLDLPWDFKRTIHSLTRLQGRPAIPRISVSGGMVLSPAQWRIPPGQLCGTEASAAKIRALVRLRNRYDLPRWVYLDCGNNKPPVPCDLESVHAIRTMERCTSGGAPLNFIEMLPAPDQFPVIDRAHRSGDRLAAQLHLRFPFDEPVHAMAARVTPAVLAALGRSAVAAVRPAPPQTLAIHRRAAHMAAIQENLAERRESL